MRRRLQRLMISIIGLGLAIAVRTPDASAATPRDNCPDEYVASCYVCQEYCDWLLCVVYDCYVEETASNNAESASDILRCQCGL